MAVPCRLADNKKGRNKNNNNDNALLERQRFMGLKLKHKKFVHVALLQTTLSSLYKSKQAGKNIKSEKERSRNWKIFFFFIASLPLPSRC